MLKIYCSDCGKPHEYSTEKPKFCCGCGIPFGGVAKAKRAVVIEDDNNEEDEVEVDIVDVSHLKVEITHPKIHKPTMGSVLGSGGTGYKRSVPKINKKKALNQFREKLNQTTRLQQGE